MSTTPDKANNTEPTPHSRGAKGGLHIERVPLASLHADPANARKHGERNLDAIGDSLRSFGQVEPLVVQRGTGRVIGGNGRLAVMRREGQTHADVVYLDIDDHAATRLGIALNRTAELAEWNKETLASLLDGMGEADLLTTGFDADSLKDLLADLTPPEVVEDEASAPLPDPVSKTGDLWKMGGHRLLCGDSTKGEDVLKVMGGEKAGLCFTSPPYAQQREYTDASKEHTSDWDKLMRGVFGALQMADDGQVLVNLGLVHRDGEWMPYWDGWIEWMRTQGWRRFGWYVWDQGPGLPGDWSGRFAPSHEWVFHFNKKALKPVKTQECVYAGTVYEGKGGLRGVDGIVTKWSHGNAPINDTKIPDSVCRVSREKSSHMYGHPAMFSVGFSSYFITAWPGTVYEPFSGSGTTIIAAEQLGRKCYAIEIEPRYVDVAVRRWEKLTGKQATCNGQTFAQVAESRGVAIV